MQVGKVELGQLWRVRRQVCDWVRQCLKNGGEAYYEIPDGDECWVTCVMTEFGFPWVYFPRGIRGPKAYVAVRFDRVEVEA